MKTKEAFHRVDTRSDMEIRASKAAKLAMRFLGALMQIEKRVRPSVGVSSASVFAHLYQRVFSNYLRAMKNAQTLKPHSMSVALVKDHPFKRQLDAMPHVPRVVKSIYRGDVRLAHHMAMEYWPVAEAKDAAARAWEKYLESIKADSV